MPVETIVAALAKVAKQTMPEAVVYDALPEAIGHTPAVIFWPAEGTVQWPRSATYVIAHNIEVRLLFSRADRPASDAAARPWIERMRVAIDRDRRLGGTAEDSGVTGYRYGVIEYAGVPYIGITLAVRVLERVAFPEPVDLTLARAVVGGAVAGEVR